MCTARRKGNLMFPLLITTLCRAFDVSIAKEEENLKIKGAIAQVTIA